MPKTFSTQKRVCEICRGMYSPVALHRIDPKNRDICTECLNYIRRHGPDLMAEPSPAEPIPDPLAKILDEEGETFLSSVKQFTRGMDVVWMVREGSRAGAYLLALAMIVPGSTLYPSMQGAIVADLVTWLLFSIYELPFGGVAFAIEFMVYGGIFTGYLVQKEGHIPVPVEPSDFAMLSLAFLAVATLKICWWALKVFVVEEE